MTHYFSVVVKRKGKIIHLDDYMLPGIIPDHVLDMMVVLYVDTELRLCVNCDLDTICHVMQMKETGVCRKLCPVLFHDAVKPKWKIEELA